MKKVLLLAAVAFALVACESKTETKAVDTVVADTVVAAPLDTTAAAPTDSSAVQDTAKAK